MQCRVKLFARARDLVGAAEVSIALPDAATVADLRRALARKYPALAGLLERSALAVDNEFANDHSHINGIESFWSSAKRRLQKFNGIPAYTFYLHLKECEYRFNQRQKSLYHELLKLLEKHPL